VEAGGVEGCAQCLDIGGCAPRPLIPNAEVVNCNVVGLFRAEHPVRLVLNVVLAEECAVRWGRARRPARGVILWPSNVPTKTQSFSSLVSSCVCPEPILANDRFQIRKWRAQKTKQRSVSGAPVGPVVDPTWRRPGQPVRRHFRVAFLRFSHQPVLIPAKNATLFSTFPMFVPSLSW
jgi:hypothetical protein